ncbi:hypothetical protein R9C00_28595 [Flammeovirgaceae bacterium SG7u.111]|nr:hypothetical protein [Flammeovirgaceae bacterium SG7u.132]WPO35661.1 hypothetical protein R9C00_28595 [Flammeovirgaceae bacterium SG7u.111]
MKMTKVTASMMFLLFALLGFSSQLLAQDEEAVTDEEIRKYAVTMDSVAAMKENVKVVMKEMITSNEEISVARYNDLNNAIDDEAKLEEIEATEEEIAFIKEIAAKKEELTGEIKSTLTTMAKEYMGGVKVYNKVKKALKADPEVKAKYDGIMEELAAARTPEEEAEEEQAGN